MNSLNRSLPSMAIAFGLALAAWSLDSTAATAATAASAPAPAAVGPQSGGAPMATAPHDLRTQHLRLRARCEAQAKSLGLQGEEFKVEMHRCLQQGV